MISEKRKAYLREYRRKNRERIYKYQRNYYSLNKRTAQCYKNKYYQTRGVSEKTLNGNSSVGIGRRYELLALNLLSGSVDKNRDNFQGGHDIEWNGKKIEVKMRNKNKNGVWGFTIGKNCNATHLLLFCVESEKIKRILFLPNNSSLAVSETNYKKYEIIFSNEELSLK